MAIISTTRNARGYQEEDGLVQIAVRISREQFEELKRYAVKENVSIAAKIRQHIEIGIMVDGDMEEDSR